MIGIAGLCRAAGTTHFSIQLANYLTGVRRKHTAVLEWNQSGCFERLRKMCMVHQTREPFSVLDVHYFSGAGKDRLIDCMNGIYQYIIIDFGDNYEEIRTEFLRCDLRFIVTALSEWQLQSFLDFAGNLKNKEERELEYFMCFGSEETRLEIRRSLHMEIRRIPVSEDAFTITKKAIDFFETLIR